MTVPLLTTDDTVLAGSLPTMAQSNTEFHSFLTSACAAMTSSFLNGCRKLCWRVNAKPVDQSLALRSDLLFGAADLRRDLFVGLAFGQAPQELLFARAEDQSGFALRTGCLIVTELVAACSHVPGSTLPSRSARW